MRIPSREITEKFLERGDELRFVTCGGGSITWVNAAWKALTGLTAERLQGLALADLLHPEDRSAWMAMTRAGGCSRVRSHDGAFRTVKWLELWREADGSTAGIGEDVTEHLRNASQMRELEQATRGGGWEIDLTVNQLYWSPGTYAIHDLDPSREKPKLENGLSFYPPEALALLEPAVRRLMSDGEPYELELPFISAQGRRLWVRVTARSQMQGAVPVRVYGSVQDITAERERRIRLEELSAVALRIESLVVLCDRDRRITWVNPAFEHMSGYALREVIGRKPGDFLQFPQTDPETVAHIGRELDAQRPVRATIENISRKGERYWIDLAIQPTFDGDGSLTGFIGLSNDVTVHRRREARLEALSREAETARAQLVAAVNTMPDAFAYYDASDRLVLCNERYREIYAASAPAIVLGARFEDVLRHGLKHRQYEEAVGREEEWLADRLATHRSEYYESEQKLGDGRWLRVIERATPDGGRIGLRVDVTEAKRAEQRLSDIIRGSEAGTWEWNVQTGETIFNARWAEIIGWTLDDLSPTTIETWMKFVHPDDLAASQEALDRHFAGDADFYECEARMRHRDGRWVWVLDRGRVATFTTDGKPEWVYGIHLDITARKEAEDALTASEERFRALFENLPDGVALLDADTLELQAFNPATPRMLGYAPETFLSLPMDVIEGLDGSAAQSVRLKRALAEGREDYEATVSQADGAMVHLAVSLLSLRQTRRPQLLAVMRDVSELRRQNEELQKAREAADAANAAKSQFLANMSHEIRTPMNGVMGMTEALMRRLHKPETRAMAETIRRSGDALLTVLNDILDFSKIEAGKIELEQARFSPLELIARIEAIYEPLITQKGVQFVVRIDMGAQKPRIGDSVRITQILHNLLGNALKFTARGSIQLTVEANAHEPLKVTVRDSGIGMTEEQLAHLFEPFRQADATTSRRFGGTWLGMSIVSSLVDLMNGAVTVESWPREGTSIEISLPLPFAMEETDASCETAAPAVEGSLEGLRVLAADDNEINRMVLKEFLAALGVAATIVDGGSEAIIAAANHRFDLILLDISMPGVDGEQALTTIRAHAATSGHPRTPAIAVTANAFPEQVAGYLAAGFDGHAAKPLSLPKLREAMLRVGAAP
jgi:PAS domain S-box-containing protein